MDAKEFLARSILALRSGTYRQVVGYLRQDGGYCAEGVMCDVLVRAGLGAWDPLHEKPPFDGMGKEVWLFRAAAGPVVVRTIGPRFFRLVGLPKAGPRLRLGGGACATVSALNDLGVDFAFIADAIEAWAVREGYFDTDEAVAQATVEAELNEALDGMHAVGV